MKRRTMLGGLAAMAGIGLPVLAPAREPFIIVHGESFAPFNWRDDKGELRGILLDVLTQALQARMGVPVLHGGYPWLRGQKMVEEGLADAFCTVVTPERLAFARASTEPVYSGPFTLFCRRDNPNLARLRQARTLADLRAFHLVHYLGSGWAKANLVGGDVSWANTQNAALSMVAARRGDAIVDSSLALRWAIRQLDLQNELIELPQVFTTQTFHLMIRKTSTDVALLPRFDQAVRQLRADGIIRHIIEKYRVDQPVG